MESIRKDPKVERAFYEENDKIKYNKLCLSCTQQCKQSFRVQLMKCKNRDDTGHIPSDYLREINKQKLDVKSVAKNIKVNSRTLTSMLNEKQDLKTDIHDKLDRILFPNSKRNTTNL